MLALQFGLIIFVLIFVPVALLFFNARQRHADQEQRLARLERKINALLGHFGIPYDDQPRP